MADRRCERCNCILRRANLDIWCAPCSEVAETQLPDSTQLMRARARATDILPEIGRNPNSNTIQANKKTA